MYDKIRVLELEEENKRLKLLAHDLQKEIEVESVRESRNTRTGGKIIASFLFFSEV